MGLLFEDVAIAIDTNVYTLKKNAVALRGEKHLAFRYTQEETIAEVTLLPASKAYFSNKTIAVLPSSLYDLLDSVQWYSEGYFRFRLRLNSLSRSDFAALRLRVSGQALSQNVEVRLLPWTETRATLYPGNEDLYIGEEKRFEIATNQPQNLRTDELWQRQGIFEYRTTERNGVAYLHLLPTELGVHTFEFKPETFRPFINEKGQPSHQLPAQSFKFLVKGSRLSFLKIDRKEIVRERGNREGIEIQIDNHRLLQLHKTYRIEDREERGGPLVAELHTLRALSNDKVLCLLRPYLNHKTSDGYLFIKDGDEPRFITNVNISPEATISTISILREGQDWTTDRTVRPGEAVELKIEGEGLKQARFYFEDIEIAATDTITRNDRVATYKLRVPTNINKRFVNVYNGDKKTGYTIGIREYERPRPLDFVKLNYGEGEYVANTLNQPVLARRTVRDIVMSFDYDLIDSGTLLYGKQILEVEIRITGPRDELIEMQKIDHIEVCPGERSPRHAFYQGSSCNRQEIRLNSVLSRKTHSLDPWSRIEIRIRHKKDRYGGEGYEQRVGIYLQRNTTFDVDVSFPAGLVIKRVGVDGFPGLSGISLAMLAQFSFYEQGQVRRMKPYKLGAGFLAQNAFNFNPDVEDRDLGIVILGSVYPTRRDSKLSFPLYGGAGYFLNNSRFFFLIGPGIRIAL